MLIKRIKIGKKYYVIAERDGIIIEKTPYSQKRELASYRNEFHKNGTWRQDIAKIERTDLSKVREVSIYGREINPAKENSFSRYQYFFKAKIKGVVIFSSSQLHERSYPVENARNEAYGNLLGRISEQLGNGRYEEQDGEKVLNETNGKLEIDEGIKFYESISVHKNEATA